MLELQRTTSENADFVALVRELDAYLALADGDDHAFYHQFNSIAKLNHVVVAYFNNAPVGCGAVKPFEGNKMEVKRMYTKPMARGNGIAGEVLLELEAWSKEMGVCACILETGVNQQEAIGFYRKMGYERVDNYGQYVGVENSFCFEKLL
ncbi:MAG: GNAT family N-acetyltransferase [Crocinitomicaceae bacterium]